MGYLDTSVLAAYYCPESLSVAVEKALRRIDTPTISPLVEVELHSAVALKTRKGELDAASAHRILAQFRVHLADGYYRVVAIQTREFALARDWIGRLTTPLRTLDALHLAAAFAQSLPLITTDKSLAASAKHFGIKHRLIS